MNEPVRHLRRRFADRVLAEAPASVLDAGCGGGELLAMLAEASPAAVGVEASPVRAAAARGLGLSVAVAAAEALPFPDGAFDWVAIRHVLHHLSDPVRALAEARRVARAGLVIAEPWRDERLPEQALARRMDRWTKARDRAAGQVHDEDIPPERLRSMLEAVGRFDLQHDTYLRPERMPDEEVERRFASYLDALAPDSAERPEALAVLEEARATGIGWTGTATVVARCR